MTDIIGRSVIDGELLKKLPPDVEEQQKIMGPAMEQLKPVLSHVVTALSAASLNPMAEIVPGRIAKAGDAVKLFDLWEARTTAEPRQRREPRSRSGKEGHPLRSSATSTGAKALRGASSEQNEEG